MSHKWKQSIWFMPLSLRVPWGVHSLVCRGTDTISICRRLISNSAIMISSIIRKYSRGITTNIDSIVVIIIRNSISCCGLAAVSHSFGKRVSGGHNFRRSKCTTVVLPVLPVSRLIL